MGKNYYLKDRDILDQALEHSWGKSAEAKAKERAYNREYYQRHKEEILRKARQAGEGIRTEIDTLTSIAKGRGNDRREINPKARTGRSMWLHGKGTAYITDDPRVSRDFARYNMKDAKRRADDWANRYKEDTSEGFRGAANIALEANREAYKTYRDEQDRYDVMRKAAVSRSHAEDEVAREKRRRGAERRFDSKIVRDAQNAYSKVRGKGREAKREFDSAMTNARSNVENAFNNAGRAVEDIYNNAQKVAKRYRTSTEQRQKANSYKIDEWVAKQAKKLANYEPKDPVERERFAKEMRDKFGPDVYERMRRKAATRVRQAGAAANEAAKASMTRAQKEALRKREEAKRRMQKWFNR